MTLSLAKDELHYGPEQLVTLSKQIKVGDLTPVLELYEEDIKRPLKSALTGTLLRSVFVQVQKAKVLNESPVIEGTSDQVGTRWTSTKH
jgi:nuclear control of ATPase protein 2